MKITNTIGASCPPLTKIPFDEVMQQISGKFRHWEITSEVEHAVQKLVPCFEECTQGSGMSFSIHSSIADTNIAAVNDRMNEASVMEIMSEIEVAAEMGIDLITVHPGLTCRSVEGMRDRSLAKSKCALRILEHAGEEYGVKVGVENMPDIPIFLGITAKELNSLVEGTNLGITFDIGHAHTSGQTVEIIDCLRERFVNVHIHDNHGESDEHLTIGDGTVDYGYVLSCLSDYYGYYIIESKSMESAVESKERLLYMFGQ